MPPCYERIEFDTGIIVRGINRWLARGSGYNTRKYVIVRVTRFLRRYREGCWSRVGGKTPRFPMENGRRRFTNPANKGAHRSPLFIPYHTADYKIFSRFTTTSTPVIYGHARINGDTTRICEIFLTRRVTSSYLRLDFNPCSRSSFSTRDIYIYTYFSFSSFRRIVVELKKKNWRSARRIEARGWKRGGIKGGFSRPSLLSFSFFPL